MHEAARHARSGERGEVGAGLGQAHAAQAGAADRELPSDEVVQGDAAGEDVAAGVGRPHLEVVVAAQGLDRLGLDQRDLAARPRRLRPLARAGRVPVAVDADPGDERDLLVLGHPLSRASGGEQPGDDPVGHTRTVAASARVHPGSFRT